MEPTVAALLAAAGFASGFVNTVAGGGSMLTLPALMLAGLDADVANGTNRVAVVAQGISGTGSFYRQGKLDLRLLGSTLAPTLVGAVIGALGAAMWVPKSVLKPVLLGTMLALALYMMVRPKAWEGEGAPRTLRERPAGILGLFVAGLYGGFVQAGVGFVLLAVLAGMLRHDLVSSNAVKLACITVFSVAALAVFVLAGQVDWRLGGILSASTVLGSLLGVRYALKAQPRALRFIVFGAIVASTLGALLR